MAENFDIVSIKRIKDMHSLKAAYTHNFRLEDVFNADSALAHLNEELIKLPTDKDGRELSYEEAFEERISEIPYFQKHRPRRNANIALEVVLTFSREQYQNVNIEEWQRESLKWLDKTFNVAGDGKDNVISCVFHGDEPGNIHIHAMVVPIDENGHLNSMRWYEHKSELLDDHAKAMEQFGLIRGMEHSRASHRILKSMYKDLAAAIEDIPTPEQGESAQEYYIRTKNHIVETTASAFHEIEVKSAEEARKNDESFVRQKELLRNEFRCLQAEAAFEREDAEIQRDQAKAELEELENAMKELQIQYENTCFLYGVDPDEMAELLKERNLANFAMESAPELYDEYLDVMDRLSEAYEQRETVQEK